MGITSLRRYHEATTATEASHEAPVAGEAPASPTDPIKAIVADEQGTITTGEFSPFAIEQAPTDAEAELDAEVEADAQLDADAEAAPAEGRPNRGSSRAIWAAYGEAEFGSVEGWTDGMTRDQLAAHYLGDKAE